MTFDKQPFEEILYQYEPLIKAQMKKLNLYRQHDDYYQIGAIALWEAYKNFDADKGSFSAYALHTVRGHMLMMLRKEQQFAERHLLYDSLERDLPPFRELIYERNDIVELLTPYLHYLSPREKLWLYEAIIAGKKLGELASEQGVSTNTAATWRKKALQKKFVK